MADRRGVISVEEQDISLLDVADGSNLLPVFLFGITCGIEPGSVDAGLFKTPVYEAGAVERIGTMTSNNIFTPDL